MIKDFCLAWEKNKEKLEEYFRTTKNDAYSNYGDLVKVLFDIVINPYLDSTYKETFDTDEIVELDDGSYQGTLVFILHKDCYQPYVCDYVYTNTYYGSCSYCDTLQSIHRYDYDELPNEDQIEDYMQLCLHLLQHCNYMDGFVEEHKNEED